MEYVTKNSIITHKVLNDNTGELESKDFMEIQKRKLVKGGFILMYYKSYEQITESVITSNKDLKLFHWITNQFTKNRIESVITHTACTVDVSQPKFSKFVKQLVELNYLCRVSRGIYRLNPFVYVPYQSNAETLQTEWIELTKKASIIFI